MTESGRTTAAPPRVVIFNNEIMPYRVKLFSELNAHGLISPHVLFSTLVSWERSWTIDESRIDFPHEILPGFFVRVPKLHYRERRTIWVHPTLYARLRQLRPDVIVGYEYSLSSLIGLLYARRHGCAYVTWTEMTAHTNRDLSWDQRLSRRIIVPLSRAFFGTSRATCEDLASRKAASGRVVLTPQTFEVERFRSAARRFRDEARAEPTIAYLGFLNPRKGVNLLLEAFACLHRDDPRLRLKLIGEGASADELKGQARRLGIDGAVEFCGFVPPGRVPRLLCDADVFAFPTLEDTFGLAVLEAAACGLAVVCSPFAGVASHLTDGVDAFVADPNDPVHFAGRIPELLDEPDLRRRFVSNVQPVLDACSPSVVARRVEAAIHEVLA